MNTAPAPLLREQLRLWLDLHHDLADELARDPVTRERFYRLLRAAWNNVSALHAGVLQVLLARCAADQSPAALAALAESLDESAWPELGRYPNSTAVTLAAPGSRLSPDAGAVHEKLSTLRVERDEARRQSAAQRDLARLRHQLLGSRRVALARSLGLGRELASDTGRTPEEKLAHLRAAVARHAWSRHLAGDSDRDRHA